MVYMFDDMKVYWHDIKKNALSGQSIWFMFTCSNVFINVHQPMYLTVVVVNDLECGSKHRFISLYLVTNATSLR